MSDLSDLSGRSELSELSDLSNLSDQSVVCPACEVLGFVYKSAVQVFKPDIGKSPTEELRRNHGVSGPATSVTSTFLFACSTNLPAPSRAAATW